MHAQRLSISVHPEDPRVDTPSVSLLQAIIGMILPMFFAATDTVSTTQEWLIAYLASNPDIQRKVQNSSRCSERS